MWCRMKRTAALGRSVAAFMKTDVEPFCDRLAELAAEIDPTALPIRGDRFHREVEEAFRISQIGCRQFENAHRDDSVVILETQERFRQATDTWLSQSWIAHRARNKPSGFPGDYEMLVKLYDEQTPARGLGGYLDLCILDLPLARAVRARMKWARQFLLDEIGMRTGNIRILDIAAGPCREFSDWPMSGNHRSIEVVAMDSDPLALQFVTSSVVSRLPGSIRLEPVRYNALRTRSAATTVKKFGRFDLLYSVGLCDYLSDEHLIAMLSAWRETLRPGGTLLVAFKDTERYDETPYQWHLDWFFFQRTREDVLNLYERAGFPRESIATPRDETGIIINLVHHVPADRRTRTDAPATQLGHVPIDDVQQRSEGQRR